MKKILGFLAAIVIVFAIVFVFFFGKGFGLGSGTGDGEGNGANAEQDISEDDHSEVQDVKEEVNGSADEITIVIEVKQSQYLINGEETTLSEIESLLSAENAENTSFILEDNYASSKAWDEIKALFTSYEISVVEQ